MNLPFLTSRGRRAIGVRLLAISAVLASVSAIGFVTLPASSAEAADDASSAVTVAWRGGNDPELQKFQVDHEKLLTDASGNDAGSGHWDDFKDLKISVSKTQGLVDEVIEVTATGMAATSSQTWEGSASNYLQMFQCWGPDPLAANFAETCQFGSWSQTSGDARADQTIRKALGTGANTRGQYSNLTGFGYSEIEIPFRTATGAASAAEMVDGSWTSGTAKFYAASNANEKPFVRIASNSATTTGFEVQTAVSQPYLGCGRPIAEKGAGQRCWLVVVPRGTHSGELSPSSQGDCATAARGGKPYGQQTLFQIGSPVIPSCSFWSDRVVVPLDFGDLRGGCAAGGAEQTVVGSEFLSGAMSSWQQRLCPATGTVYGMVTNSSDLARAQLLNGQADLTVVADAFRSSSVGVEQAGLLDDARLVYAPMANTALSISYVASTASGRQIRDLKLTPRLIAKMLTQSYKTDVANIAGSEEAAQPAWSTMPHALIDDQEFLALNPEARFQLLSGVFLAVGPFGDDALTQLWRYIQADADAVAFLRGEPDPWGNTINPYYLPAGHPRAIGSGFSTDLSSNPIDGIVRADQTVSPQDPSKATAWGGRRLDSLTMLPYSGSFAANAGRVFRGDTRYTNEWDPNKVLTPQDKGAFIPAVPQTDINGRFTLGPADAATAADYKLDSAQLAIPLGTTTGKGDLATARQFVPLNDASLGAAAEAISSQDGEGAEQLDLGALPEGAYPLTFTLYGVTDLGDRAPEPDVRERLAQLLDFVTTEGNARGEQPGLLPAGFVPLTDTQIARTRTVSELLRLERGGTPPADPAGGVAAAPAAGAPAGAMAVPNPGQPAGADAQTTVSSLAVEATAATASAPGSPAALGGALVAGLVGVVASPFLLRRRVADR